MKDWLTSPANPRWVASNASFRGLADDEKDEYIEDACRAYPTWFYEVLTEINGGPFELHDYQGHYLLDDNPFTIKLKCRQGGGSLAVAAKHFFKAYTTPGYKVDILSVNVKEATDKIQYVKMFYESLPLRWRHPLAKDNELALAFHSGAANRSIIRSLAATASGVRGGSRNLVFDEGGHIPGFRESFQAAAPAIIRRKDGGIDLLSTPSGVGHLFEEIWSNRPDHVGRRHFDMFTRHQFGWWDVPPFVRDGDVEAARARWAEYGFNVAHMPALVEEFGSAELMFFVDIYPWEMFLQEFCCVFVDETTAYFPWELINQCLRSDHKDEPERLEKWFARPDGNDHEVWMGVDFATGKPGGDMTAIEVVENDGGIYKERYSEVLKGLEWSDIDRQEGHITELIGKFRPQKVSMDGTGLGIKIGQDLKKVHGGKLEPITFDNLNKAEMALNVKDWMERQRIWIQYDNKQLHGQIHGIKRTALPSGGIRYAGEPHDDMFWALALAMRGANRREFRIYRLGGSP